MGDSESDSEAGEDDNNYALRNVKISGRRKIFKRNKQNDLEEGTEDNTILTTNKVDNSSVEEEGSATPEISSKHGTIMKKEESKRAKVTSLQLPKVASAMTSMSNLEQSMPADAVLAKEGAAEVSNGFMTRITG